MSLEAAQQVYAARTMTTDVELRDALVSSLKHVDEAFDRVAKNSGPTKSLHAPDVHKLSEGLFLNAWTHWEAFLRRLFIRDLATDPNGVLGIDVAKFRSKGAAARLAERIVEHPDEGKFVEWSRYDVLRSRANELPGAGHRYASMTGAQVTSIARIKTIRNAVAHRSDEAWAKFRKLVLGPPFHIAPTSMKGMTIGRLPRK